MFKVNKYFILNSLWAFSYRKYRYLFRGPVSNVQEKLLLGILRKNKNTEYGRKYDFDSIRGIKDFQKKVPLLDYEPYIPYIRRICEGEKKILTQEAVLNIGVSSGSTSASKYVPYTKELKKQFQSALGAWIFDLYTQKPKLLSGRAYWSITPAALKNKKTECGIPIGFEDDSEYFGLFEKLMLKFLLVMPPEVCKIEDMPSFRYVTLLFLLKAADLALISIWNPTFLIILLKPVLDYLPLIIEDIKNGAISCPGNINAEIKSKLIKKLPPDKKRAEELNLIFTRHKAGKLTKPLFEEIWPNLTLISCWTDASAAPYAEDLKRYFPNVEVQGKGLLATEGFVSFPVEGSSGCVLAVKSHFFEFIEADDSNNLNKVNVKLKLAHQLEKGKKYSVVITGGGGLYRYKLQDIIEVIGFKKEYPLIRFAGKASKVSDLFGEKLNEYHVSSVLSGLFAKYNISPSFFMVAPEKNKDRCFYVLFIEMKKNGQPRENLSAILNNLAREFEEKLLENYHYSYCRKLTQLSVSRIFIISCGADAIEIYNSVCESLGQRGGDIKPAVLDLRTGWSEKFQGYFTDEAKYYIFAD